MKLWSTEMDLHVTASLIHLTEAWRTRRRSLNSTLPRFPKEPRFSVLDGPGLPPKRWTHPITAPSAETDDSG